jgi:hypothetical protein
MKFQPGQTITTKIMKKHSLKIVSGMLLLAMCSCSTTKPSVPKLRISRTARVAVMVTPFVSKASQTLPETRKEAALGGVGNAMGTLRGGDPRGTMVALFLLPATLTIFPTVAAAQGVSEADLKEGLPRVSAVLSQERWPSKVAQQLKSTLQTSDRATTVVNSASAAPAGSDYLLHVEVFGPKLDTREKINPRMPVRVKLYGHLIDRRTGIKVRLEEAEGQSQEERKFLDWARGDGPPQLESATQSACADAVEGLLRKLF